MSLRSYFGRIHQRREVRRANQGLTNRPPRFESLEDRHMLSFTPAVNYGTTTDPQVVVTADFNNDGRLDLVTANRGSNSVNVRLGNVGGSFGPAIASPAGIRPQSIAVGDFDDDGNLDLAAVSESTNPFVTVVFGNGSGSFVSPSYISLGRLASPLSEPLPVPMSVAVGDFNEDHLMDIAVAAGYNTHYPGYCCGGVYTQVQVILAHGDRTFSAPNVALTSGVHGYGVISPLVVTDFNGDDDLDLLVGAPADRDYVRVLLGDGEGRLELAGDQYWVIGDTGLASMAVGDVNRDGVLDLVAQDLSHVRVRLGNGLAGFQSPPGGQSYAAGDRPISVLLGDFDRDGNFDVAAANYDSENVSILRGRGDGTFAPPEHFSAGLGTISIAAGDFNGDGWLDLATANATGNNVSVLLNNQAWGTPPTLVSISDASVTEGNTGTVNITFLLTASRAVGVDVTVRYDTANITATSGSDYIAASGTVVIPAGQTSRTITIAVKGDRRGEPTETFAVNLSNPTNAILADGQGIGTILDDEPQIRVSDVARAEGRRNTTTLFTFTVTLSAAYDQAVTITYSTVNGTAKTANNDYVAKSGTLTFAPGETTKTIMIEVLGDSKREADEVFYLDLFGNSGQTWFTKNRGIGTILNDD